MRLTSLILVCILVTACQQQMSTAAQETAILAESGTLVSAGTMSTSRAAHTATVLPDGRVLLAGGMASADTDFQDAETFNPESNQFTGTAPMVVKRQSHTATLLANGKVLITGGYGERGEYLSSSEIFDPETDTFSEAPSMVVARAGHVAIRLLDNRVLLVGGVGTNWTFLSSAEIYDPVTETYSPTGSMAFPRESHAVVMLEDGRALILGGHRDRRENIVLYTSVEIFDPATGSFSPAGEMAVRRHKHDAVLLPDGRILITGGTDERDAGGIYSSSEIFDVNTGTSSESASLQVARYKHNGTSVVLPDGRILIAGGATKAEVFDPDSATFQIVGGEQSMPGQFAAASLLPDGRVLITGGYGSSRGPQAGAWLFLP